MKERYTTLAEDLRQLGLVPATEDKKIDDTRKKRRKRLLEQFTETDDDKGSSIIGVIGSIDELIASIKSAEVKGEDKKEKIVDKDKDEDKKEDVVKSEDVSALESVVALLQVLEGKFSMYKEQSILSSEEMDKISIKMDEAEKEIGKLVEKRKKGEKLEIQDFNEALGIVKDLTASYMEFSEDIAAVKKDVDKSGIEK